MLIQEKRQKHILTVFLNTSDELLVSGIFGLFAGGFLTTKCETYFFF